MSLRLLRRLLAGGAVGGLVAFCFTALLMTSSGSSQQTPSPAPQLSSIPVSTAAAPTPSETCPSRLIDKAICILANSGLVTNHGLR